MKKKNSEIIAEIYANGWNPEYVKISETSDGIKVRGSLTRINWSQIKFEFYVRGYSYDKATKTFKKTHESRELKW